MDDLVAQQRVAREVLSRALGGEPDLHLDLGEIRAAGRRRRRSRQAWATAGGAAAVVVVAVTMAGAVPAFLSAPAVQPAGSGPVVTDRSDRPAADADAVAQAQRSGNVWRARAMEAVVGTLAQQASAVPVQELPLVEELAGEEGSDAGTRARLVVDVLGVADDREDHGDLEVLVHNGTGSASPGPCDDPAMRCETETREDGSVLRWGSAGDAGPSAAVVAQLDAGSTRVQVTSHGQVAAGAAVPPALTVEQARAVALAPVLRKPLP